MSFKELWSTTEAAESKEFTTLPMGNYLATINQVSVDVSKEPNRITFEYDMLKYEGDETLNVTGRKAWSSSQLNKIGISYLKKDLTALGLSLDGVSSVEDLGEILGKTNGMKVRVYVKTKPSDKDPTKTFTNVYINELVSASDDLGF